MSTQKQNEITHEGVLQIGDISIPCYVLKNGKRVLSSRGMQNAMILNTLEGKREEEKSGVELSRFLRSKWFRELIVNKYGLEHFSPVVCYKGNQKINGYEATTLADLCNVMLDARNLGVLSTERQALIAAQCEILIRAFAKVGIISLVDEATGYQEVREKTALRQFLEKFLLEEKGVWLKTFPDEFFESIFRMKGWDWRIANKGKKPQVVGHYINNYVYSRLAPHVLTELRKRNPKNEKGNRKGKHPQWIDVDFGHPKLKEHLSILTAFAKATGYNWNNWTRMVERAMPKFHQDGSAAQEIDFQDD